MKKTLLLIAAVVALAACTKTVEVPVEVEVEKIVDILTLDAAQLQVPNKAVEQPITFTTEDSWTISSEAAWITFDKTSGAKGSNTVSMKVAKSEVYSTRTGRVTLSTTHSGTTKNTVFTVVQSEKEVFNTSVDVRVDYTEQNIEIAYNSNLTPEVKVVEGAWLAVVQTKADPADGKIVVSVAANEELDSRSGSFTVAAGGNVQTYNVLQASQYAAASSATALFLGNSQDCYSMETGFKTFAQYAIQFATAEGNVTLALNVDPNLENKTQVPVGEYVMDDAATYAPGTFSISTGAQQQVYYTTVVEGEKEMTVIDGKVSVTKNGDIYSIVAELTDIAGTTHLYSYKGELAATDASLGLFVYTAESNGQYNTFFTTKAYETRFALEMNQPVSSETYISFVQFNIFSEAFDGTLPTGKFTYQAPATDSEQSYANGIQISPAGTFYLNSFNKPDWDGASYAPKEGTDATLEIIKQDNGLYTIKTNMTIVRTYTQDEEVINEEVPFNGTFTNVAVGQLSDSGMRIAPDGDAVLENGGTLTNLMQGQFYGDPLGTGSNIATLGWTAAHFGCYYVFLTFDFGPDFEFVASIRDRYSTQVVPDGTYPYSDAVISGEKSILPGYYSTSSRCYIKNNYTGTVYYITGGSVSFSGGNPTFDLIGTNKFGEVAHFTGSFPSGMSTNDGNYRKETYQARFNLKPYVVPAQ